LNVAMEPIGSLYRDASDRHGADHRGEGSRRRWCFAAEARGAHGWPIFNFTSAGAAIALDPPRGYGAASKFRRWGA
jgi:hypothetical protein